MSDSNTTSVADEPADNAKIGRDAVALTEAFSDSPIIELPESPDLRLLQAVPPPAPVAFDELEKESTSHRVLFLRGGAVIAVTTIISIGGALFIHSLFAGIFILGALFGFSTPHGTGNGGDSMSEGGASPEGYLMMGDPSAPEMRGALASLGTPDSTLLALPAPTQLPALPEPSSVDVAVQQLQSPIPVVSVPTSSDMGTVNVHPPAREATTLSPDTLVVMPPAPVHGSPNGSNTVASAVSNGNAPSAAESGDGEERVFGLFKGDGAGKGKGSGHGNGIDRGFSAANSEPQPLSFPPFVLPMQYQLKPPTRPIVLEIIVLADGTVGNVRVTQSCGIKELDDLLVVLARTSFRYRPAFRDGKAVQSPTEYTENF